MVDYHSEDRDFLWMWDAWHGSNDDDGIRDRTTASETGDRGDITVTCTEVDTEVDPFGCIVEAMTITDMSQETVVRQLARVYDLHTGLAEESRPWGAAQLYFASRYPNCSTRATRTGDTSTAAGDLLGAEALADTLLHITLPHAPLHYSESRECRGLPTSPSRTAEEVVREALDARDECDLPDWYLDRSPQRRRSVGRMARGPVLPGAGQPEDRLRRTHRSGTRAGSLGRWWQVQHPCGGRKPVRRRCPADLLSRVSRPDALRRRVRPVAATAGAGRSPRAPSGGPRCGPAAHVCLRHRGP